MNRSLPDGSTSELKSPVTLESMKENSMKLSQTVENWASNRGEYYYRMLEICDKEGFDLDDMLFDIWKETEVRA